MSEVFFSSPGPSTSRAWVVWPSFAALKVTVPAFLTEGLAGSILNSVSESLTVEPPPEGAAGCVLFDAPPPPLSLLSLPPQPATARAPAARTAIERRCAVIRPPRSGPERRGGGQRGIRAGLRSGSTGGSVLDCAGEDPRPADAVCVPGDQHPFVLAGPGRGGQ